MIFSRFHWIYLDRWIHILYEQKVLLFSWSLKIHWIGNRYRICRNDILYCIPFQWNKRIIVFIYHFTGIDYASKSKNSFLIIIHAVSYIFRVKKRYASVFRNSTFTLFYVFKFIFVWKLLYRISLVIHIRWIEEI